MNSEEKDIGPTDDLGVDVPDIPLPENEDEGVGQIEDAFVGAYNFAVVGVGQGGSRLAETFFKLGYRRVAAINTARQDLTGIQIPDGNKLLVGDSGGAGKDRAVASSIFNENREDIHDFLKKAFGSNVDRILVCVGAGGGTGAGGGPVVFEVAKGLCDQVGVVVALPKRSEGHKVMSNAKETLGSFVASSEDGSLSPLIILDNEKIKKIYPKLTVGQFWTVANQNICSLFHLFNTVSARDSDYTSFDKADLDTVLNSGIISFGAVPVKSEDGEIKETDVSSAVRDNLKKNVLANIDIKTGSHAACVVLCDKETLDSMPQEYLEYGFDQLTRILSEGSTVHRGIYHSSKKGLFVYTIIGGIKATTDLLK